MLEGVSVAGYSTAAGAAFLVSILGLAYLGIRPIRRSPVPTNDHASVFLFEGADLVDANQSAEELLDLSPTGGSDWSRMLSALGQNFPGLSDRLSEIDQCGTVGVRSVDGTSHLVASSTDGRIRISLSDTAGEPDAIRLEPPVFRTLLREVETLRAALEGMPFLVWRQTPDGRLMWANSAYLALAGGNGGQDRDWPPPPLFDAASLSEVARDGTGRRLRSRAALSEVAPDENCGWYECRALPVAGDYLFSAVGIDNTVKAERQLHEFMQTLTNTFSHLKTGLAIFDKQRRLTMFNPALTDLTGLPVDFLAMRPTLYSFLDRLRDRRMVPEPKDFGSWRRQISELEAAALDGTYSETWSLPDNRTYEVTGRPHHGGALAFLIEDISSEMSLTRKFRSEVELGQAVIDALDKAIVVFSPIGELALVNREYEAMWGKSHATTLDLPTVSEMSRHWMSRGPSPVWGEIREFILHARDRTKWNNVARLADGTALDCRVVPLAGGATMVSFETIDWLTGQEAKQA